MNKIKFPKHFKTLVLTALVALGADTKTALTETLNMPTDTLSKNEMRLNSKLDKFIDAGYDCVVSADDFINEGNVIDAEGILTEGEENLLETIVENIKEKNGVKLLLVTKGDQSRSGSMSEFGTGLGYCLGVRLNKNVDNGLVVQLDTLDHKTFISTGAGIEAVLTDVEAGRLSRSADSYFKKGDFTGGLQVLLDGVDKAINPEEEQEMQDNIKKSLSSSVAPVPEPLTILLFAIALGVVSLGGGFSISTIRAKKREYDRLISRYNSNQGRLSDQIKEWSTLSVRLEKQQEKIEEIDFKKYPWARDIFKGWQSDYREQNKTFNSKVMPEGKHIKDSFQNISGSWSGFVTGHGKKVEEENIQDNNRIYYLEGTINDATILFELGEEDRITFNKIKNIGKYTQKIGDKIKEIKEYMKENIKKGYVFPKIKKSIGTNIASIERDTELLDTRMPDLYDNTRGFEEILSLSEEVSSTEEKLDDDYYDLVGLVLHYENITPDEIDNNMISSDMIESYGKLIDDLAKIVPDKLVVNFEEERKKVNEYQLEQATLLVEHKEAYKTKDLELSRSKYQEYQKRFGEVKSMISKLSKKVESLEGLKKKVGKKVKENEEALADTKRDLHTFYFREYNEVESELERLSRQSKLYITDWATLHKGLVSLLKRIEKIEKDSNDKFAAEKRAAKLKAEREAANNSSNRPSNGGGSGSNNYGGGTGGFNGGGGGSSW